MHLSKFCIIISPTASYLLGKVLKSSLSFGAFLNFFFPLFNMQVVSSPAVAAVGSVVSVAERKLSIDQLGIEQKRRGLTK